MSVGLNTSCVPTMINRNKQHFFPSLCIYICRKKSILALLVVLNKVLPTYKMYKVQVIVLLILTH